MPGDCTVGSFKPDRLPSMNLSRIIKIHIPGIFQMPFRLAFAPPQKKFLIFCRGRSGSTLLYQLLNQHPEINCQGELLHSPTAFPKWRIRYYETLNRKTCFGFKLLTYQCTDVLKLKDTAAFLDFFEKRGYQLIYLERKNLLRQALSNIIAFQTNNFQGKKDRSPKIIPVEKLRNWLNLLEKRKQLEQQWLAGRNYLHLVYEDDLQHSHTHQKTIDKICAFLDVPIENLPAGRSFPVQSFQDMIANYSEIEAFLKDTPHHFEAN